MEPATDVGTVEDSVTAERGRFNRGELLAGAGAAAAALGLGLPGLAQAKQLHALAADAGVKNLRWALSGAPSSFDVAANFSGDTMVAMYLTQDTLVSYDAKLNLVPVIASKVANPTPTKYVYTLKPGIKFSDGSPVTADDVVYSILRNVNPKLGSQVQSYFPTVKKVAKTGPNEVTVTLKQVDPLYKYAMVYAPIIPKKFATAKGKKLGAQGNGTWISTGPYMLKSFTGDKIVLVRNPHYWGKKPSTEQITFSWISDSQTLQLAVRSGQIDGTFVVALPDITQWKTIPNINLISAPALRSWWVSFDLTQAPLSDLHVRKAFAYALNQKGIIDSILHGYGQPSNGIVPPGQWGSVLDPAGRKKLYASIPSYTYDLDKAKAELAQSSVPNGFSTSISIPSSRQYVVDAMLGVRRRPQEDRDHTRRQERAAVGVAFDDLRPQGSRAPVPRLRARLSRPGELHRALVPERERRAQQLQHGELQEPRGRRADREAADGEDPRRACASHRRHHEALAARPALPVPVVGRLRDGHAEGHLADWGERVLLLLRPVDSQPERQVDGPRNERRRSSSSRGRGRRRSLPGSLPGSRG